MRRSVVIAGMLLLACALWGAGCYRSASKDTEPPSRTSPSSVPEPGPSSSTIAGGTDGETGTARQPSEEETAPGIGPSGDAEPPADASTARSPSGSAVPAESAGDLLQEGTAPKGTSRPPSIPTAAPAPVDSVLPEDAPYWAKEKEQLVYRVEFLGMTMGYARFRVNGTVRIGDRQAYHLTVRAWTSDLLSVFYPMNDTIDYYLDVRTLAPIRLEFTKSRKEDDIAYYDQETGSIVYRYKKNGKVRKTIRAVPGVYDPVSVAYYFRTRELADEEPARPMYAGRKLWEISARPVGVETVRTDNGQFDTVMVEPVLRRDGNLEHKGNLRIWMTRDERHVPVRLYARFKKVRTWTLVGELVSDRQGGGP